MRWIEEPLAALQQAAAAAWLSTRALLWTRSSIILKKTQGSLYSRRSRLGEEPYSSPRQLISTALSLGLTPLQTNHPHSPPPLPPPSPTATNHWRSRVSPGRHNGSTSGRRRHPGGPDGPAAGACPKRPQAHHRGEVWCNTSVIGGVIISERHRMCENAISVPIPANALILKWPAARDIWPIALTLRTRVGIMQSH